MFDNKGVRHVVDNRFGVRWQHSTLNGLIIAIVSLTKRLSLTLLRVDYSQASEPQEDLVLIPDNQNVRLEVDPRSTGPRTLTKQTYMMKNGDWQTHTHIVKKRQMLTLLDPKLKPEVCNKRIELHHAQVQGGGQSACISTHVRTHTYTLAHTHTHTLTHSPTYTSNTQNQFLRYLDADSRRNEQSYKQQLALHWFRWMHWQVHKLKAMFKPKCLPIKISDSPLKGRLATVLSMR